MATARWMAEPKPHCSYETRTCHPFQQALEPHVHAGDEAVVVEAVDVEVFVTDVGLDTVDGLAGGGAEAE